MRISKQSNLCCRDTRFGHSVGTILSVKNENYSGYGEDFTKVLVKNYLGIIVHQRLTVPRRMESRKERYTETTEGTSAGLLQSVLDENGGFILWNAIFMCDMSKTSRQKEQHFYERRFGETFEAPVLPFGAMVVFSSDFLQKTSQGSTNLARRFYQEYSSEMY